jgi:hypothetical protein
VTHPRALLSAFVDGELDHDSRERILTHLAHCGDCRSAAEAERQVKALLGRMTEPALSERLHASLLDIAQPIPQGDTDHRSARGSQPSRGRVVGRTTTGRRGSGGHPGPVRPPRGPVRREQASRPARSPHPRGPHQRGSHVWGLHRRAAASVVGIAAMAGIAVAAALAAGDAPSQPPVVPPVQQFSIEHAGVVSDAPLSDLGAVTEVLERQLREQPAGQ